MATLTSNQITLTGLSMPDVTVAAASGGDKLAPGDRVFLVVSNANAASRTVTVDRTRPSNTGQDNDLVVVVPTAESRFIGPLPGSWFAGSDGLVAVTYSAHADLFVRPWLI